MLHDYHDNQTPGPVEDFLKLFTIYKCMGMAAILVLRTGPLV